MDILKLRQGAHRGIAHWPLRMVVVRVCGGLLSYVCVKVQVQIRECCAAWAFSCYKRQGAAGKLQRPILRALIVLPALLLATTGQCNPAIDFFKNILESNMDTVAVKVADLPQKYPVVYSQGMAFSPDGQYLAVESEYENVKIWDWRKGHIVTTLEIPHGANGGDNNPLQYSPDGMLLADCVGRGKGDVFVRIWNTSDWSIAQDIVDRGNGECTAAGFTPGGKLFVRTVGYRLGAPDNTIIVHDVRTWRIMWGLQPKNFAPQSFAVSPNGKCVAVAGVLSVVPPNAQSTYVDDIKHEPTIYIIDFQQRKIIKTISSKVMGPVAWSSDGNFLAIASGGLEIFSVKSGERVLFDPEKNATHMNVQYTSDGNYFIESDMNGRGTGLGVRIWDASRQHLLQKIAGNIGSIAVSHDGKYLAVGATGHTTIWQFK